MKNKILNKLTLLYSYYAGTRQIGHTTLMKKGTDNFKDRKVVLFHNIAAGKNFRYKNNEIVTWNSLDRLRGCDRPMAIDNGTMMVILDDTINEITTYKKMMDQRNGERFKLQQEIIDMKDHPWRTLWRSIFKTK